MFQSSVQCAFPVVRLRAHARLLYLCSMTHSLNHWIIAFNRDHGSLNQWRSRSAAEIVKSTLGLVIRPKNITKWAIPSYNSTAGYSETVKDIHSLTNQFQNNWKAKNWIHTKRGWQFSPSKFPDLWILMLKVRIWKIMEYKPLHYVVHIPINQQTLHAESHTLFRKRFMMNWNRYACTKTRNTGTPTNKVR